MIKKDNKKTHCEKCGKLAYLSGIDTCPACSKKWVDDYINLHK